MTKQTVDRVSPPANRPVDVEAYRERGRSAARRSLAGDRIEAPPYANLQKVRAWDEGWAEITGHPPIYSGRWVL